MKFKKGDKVKFRVRKMGEQDSIPEYISRRPIPSELIIHGSTLLGDRYKREYAKIKGLYDDVYAVTWFDINNKEMCLGFKEDVLQHYCDKVDRLRKELMGE